MATNLVDLKVRLGTEELDELKLKELLKGIDVTDLVSLSISISDSGQVTISASQGQEYLNLEGVSIRYTTDETTPVSNSNKYTGQFTVPSNTRVTALVFFENYTISGSFSGYYLSPGSKLPTPEVMIQTNYSVDDVFITNYLDYPDGTGLVYSISGTTFTSLDKTRGGYQFGVSRGTYFSLYLTLEGYGDSDTYSRRQ